MRSWLVGPRFEPAEPLRVVAPFRLAPAADGRPQKYFGSVNAWPIRLEPTVRPSLATMNEPLAWCGKATWATAVTTAG